MSTQMDSVANKHRGDISAPETEDSWERIAKGFTALKTCCQNLEDPDTSGIVQVIKSFHSAINNSLLSERTRLSSAALDLLDAVATVCDADFEPLISTFFPTLMTLTGRTNKVVINRTKTCIFRTIEVTRSVLLLPYFLNHLQEKSATMRLVSAEAAVAYLKCCNPPDIERENRASEVESIIRKTARDANPDVRKVGREIFGAYKLLLPSRVDKFTAPLTPTMRKYLDIKASTASTSQGSSKPIPKMKSVASLAAASKPAEKPKRPTPGHSRTASASSNTSERERGPSRTEVRPTSSLGSSRPTRPPAQEKVTITASRPESSRQALTRNTGASTGPSRVLSSSAEAGKQPMRTRVLPSSTSAAAPQRPLSRPALTTSTSSSLTSSGPRRVPLPSSSQSTGPVAHTQPVNRPASQQGHIATTATTSRPASQQSRPFKPTSSFNPVTKSTSGAAASRAMPPPKTRADGRPLGGTTAAPVKPSRTVATSSSSTAPSRAPAEPVKRQARAHGGLTQPTASQLAKIKSLHVQKKPGFVPTRGGAKTVSNATTTGVLGKSSKANIMRPAADARAGVKKAASPPVAPEKAAKVPLPPSPEPADIPLPEPVVSDDIDRVKTPVPVEVQEAPVPEPAVTPEPVEIVQKEEVVEEDEDSAEEEVEELVEAEPVPEIEPEIVDEPVRVQDPPFVSPEIVIAGMNDDLKDFDVYATPLHPELKTLNWGNAKTPISALLSSIQQGFEFSPSSPVSPPYTYINGEKDTGALATQLFSL